MRNPREGASVVLCDHQANLIVCVVCSCCATSSYREVYRAKGGIRSGETLSNLAVRVNRAITTGQRIQQEAICYCLSNAMHGQNINLLVCLCLCLCVRHTFCQLAYRSDPSMDFYS